MWRDLISKKLRKTSGGAWFLSVHVEDRIAALDTDKARRYLAVFAEVVYFLDERLRDGGFVSSETLPVAGFGFFGGREVDELGYAQASPSADGAMFFINYFRVAGEGKYAEDTSIFQGTKMTSPRWAWNYWTWRVLNRIVDAAVEAFGALRFLRKDFEAYCSFQSEVRSLASFYSCELHMMRPMLENKLTDAYCEQLKEQWGIPMRHRR